MKKIISSITSIALSLLCLSCGSGVPDDPHDFSWLVGLHNSETSFFNNMRNYEFLDALRPPQQQYLSNPSGSIVAETKSEDDVVVCKEVVEAEMNRIKERIRDACATKYPTQVDWCTAKIIEYASGIDFETGNPILDMDRQRAIDEGRPLWILNNIKTR